MIAPHERSLAEIESRTRFFTPVEDDGQMQQSRNRVYATVRQAEELRAAVDETKPAPALPRRIARRKPSGRHSSTIR
jgi:hypothetical protein